MAATISCPVPPDQRPQEEFTQLSQSCFFALPRHRQIDLDKALLLSWLLIVPLTVLIASGSWSLRHDPIRLVLAGAVSALILPMLLLVRQWLGWTYVHKRLLSERVEYEDIDASTNTFKYCRRGTAGTSAQEHAISTKVFDANADNILPINSADSFWLTGSVTGLQDTSNLHETAVFLRSKPGSAL